jgi:hypothetical protein
MFNEIILILKDQRGSTSIRLPAVTSTLIVLGYPGQRQQARAEGEAWIQGWA